MPNTPGAIGHGITGLYGRGDLSQADRELAEALMTSLGETLWIADEALMDVVTAVSGSGTRLSVPDGRSDGCGRPSTRAGR
jgi:pyrroline-5-carboxylate reductase